MTDVDVTFAQGVQLSLYLAARPPCQLFSALSPTPRDLSNRPLCDRSASKARRPTRTSPPILWASSTRARSVYRNHEGAVKSTPLRQVGHNSGSTATNTTIAAGSVGGNILARAQRPPRTRRTSRIDPAASGRQPRHGHQHAHHDRGRRFHRQSVLQDPRAPPAPFNECSRLRLE